MGASDAKAAYTRHVDELWPRDQLPSLIEAGEAVERTLDSQGFKIIMEVLAAEVATIDRRLEGTALEQAEYARLHGRRSALLAAQGAGQAVVSRTMRWVRKAALERDAAAETAAREAA